LLQVKKGKGSELSADDRNEASLGLAMDLVAPTLEKSSLSLGKLHGKCVTWWADSI
jgi:hypothetical protein